MTIAIFLYCIRLALRASGLQLCYATLQNLPSGNTDLEVRAALHGHSVARPLYARLRVADERNLDGAILALLRCNDFSNALLFYTLKNIILC